MRLTSTANSDGPKFGVSAAEDGDTVTLYFDLEQIAAFRIKFGDKMFVQVATRYVEERAEALSAHEKLWLWKEAVQAHVMTPAVGGKAMTTEKLGLVWPHQR